MTSQRTRYFQPIFLEDITGRLTGSEFIDLHDRMRISYRCNRRDSLGSEYHLYEMSSPKVDSWSNPVVVLMFGPQNELGYITFQGSGRPMTMESYLKKVHLSGSSKYRQFTGQDGRQYRWSYRTHEDQEWTCVDSSGHIVAYYHLKTPGEPPYPGSSGCTLSIEEDNSDMACEFLASNIIMRHIHLHNIS